VRYYREEQLLRAQRAAELDMVDMLLPNDADNPVKMANAILTLLARDKPSTRGSAVKMEGLQNLSDSVEVIMQARKSKQ
jgi:predicted glycosyltransferase